MLFNSSNLTAGADGLRWNDRDWSLTNHFIPFTEGGVGAKARFESDFMVRYLAVGGFIEKSKRVSPTCLISFDRNRYSVPTSFANRPVSLRIYPERLVVAAEGQILCEHGRLIQRSHDVPPQTIYDWFAFVRQHPG